MIKILKQNILAIILAIVLVIIMFITILFFLNSYKKYEYKLFSKTQKYKLKELETVIGLYNKQNKDKLQVSERYFFDRINSDSPISKQKEDSIYVDLINGGITQKVKISKLLINYAPLYLNNKLLNKNRYISNTYISIWQKAKDGYIRIASSKAGLTKEEIPILIKQSNVIIKNIEDGKHYYSRKYLGFDSELNFYSPIYIDGNVEAFAQFSMPEFIPATIGRVFNYENSGLFLLNKNDTRILGTNSVFDADKEGLLIKKLISLKDINNVFEYNGNIFNVLYSLENQTYIGFVINTEEVYENYYTFEKKVFFWFFLLSIFVILSFVFFSVYNNKNSVNYLSQLEKIVEFEENEDKKTEQKTFLKNFETYYLNILENIKKLSQGDTSISIIPEFEDNQLNTFLISIKDELLNSIKEKDKQIKENKIKEKLNGGNAEITNLLQHVSNINELSFDILKSITKFLGIQQGAMFILVEKDKSLFFEMSASYAYGKKRFANKEFPSTEGLIGRAFLEKESIYITEVPENYTLIESGFGEEEPKFLLIVPLIFNNKVQAVIELGGINEIEDYKIKYVEAVGESIASTISNLKHSEQTQVLLQQTTAQSKEIEEQRKTLEEKINTHRRQNRKLDKEMLQLIEIIESIKSVTFMFEYDLNGQVVDISRKVLDLWGIKKKDVINKHHNEIVKEVESELVYKELWEDLNNNKPKSITETIVINGKEYTFIQNYVPIKNVRRKIFRFLSLGTLKS